MQGLNMNQSKWNDLQTSAAAKADSMLGLLNQGRVGEFSRSAVEAVSGGYAFTVSEKRLGYVMQCQLSTDPLLWIKDIDHQFMIIAEQVKALKDKTPVVKEIPTATSVPAKRGPGRPRKNPVPETATV